MKKTTLKVYYAKVPNMGDLLNVMIITKLFGYKVTRHTFLTGELSAIGSGLGQFMLHKNPLIACIQRIIGYIFPNVTIWGTGFICNNDKDTPFYRKNMHFAAVRGELSKKRVESIIGKALNIPTGDAGILSSYLLNKPIEKTYRVGIIAHYKEQEEPVFKELINHYDNSIFIDVKQHPSVVIEQISKCEYIISSSLHGLIIADSFHIPNIHIIVSDKLLGDGFKFDDYYSAYNINHHFIDVNVEDFPSIDYIKNNYSLTPEMIENKKKDMINSFPFPHIKTNIK